MFEKMMIYRAHCDYCRKTHNLSAPKTALETNLKMSGWEVTEDELMCPNCRVRMKAKIEVDE